MKNIKLLVTIVFFSACSQVKDELHSTGGYIGPILDESTFKAVTFRAQVDRYYYITASLAPAVLYSVTDEESAADSVRHVKTALVKLNALDQSLSACADRHTPRATSCFDNSLNNFDATPYSFESNSLELQRSMARLGGDVTNNIGLDFDIADPSGSFDSVTKVLRNARDLIGPFRNFAAAYRDTIHITAQSTIRMCETVKISNNADKHGAKCGLLVDAGEDFYKLGDIPTKTLSDPAKIERVLKTLQRRTLAVIESKELRDKGFLDDEGLDAINAMILHACKQAEALDSSKQGTNADPSDCDAAKFGARPPAPVTDGGVVAEDTDSDDPLGNGDEVEET